MQRLNWIRLVTFVAWLLAAAGAVYWVMQFVQGPSAPAGALTVAPSNASTSVVDPQALARALGGAIVQATPTTVVAPSTLQASRFQLSGVVVNRSGSAQSGVALIAVDGKPAKPYRVGANLAQDAVLHSVAAGKAMLSPDANTPAVLTLELPRQTSAVAGTAMPARPIIAAGAVPPQPAPAPPPPAAAPTPASPPVSALKPGDPASPTAAPGKRPGRPGAIQQSADSPAERAS